MDAGVISLISVLNTKFQDISRKLYDNELDENQISHLLTDFKKFWHEKFTEYKINSDNSQKHINSENELKNFENEKLQSENPENIRNIENYKNKTDLTMKSDEKKTQNFVADSLNMIKSKNESNSNSENIKNFKENKNKVNRFQDNNNMPKNANNLSDPNDSNKFKKPECKIIKNMFDLENNESTSVGKKCI